MAVGSVLTLIAVQISLTFTGDLDEPSPPSLVNRTGLPTEVNQVKQLSGNRQTANKQGITKSHTRQNNYPISEPTEHQNSNECLDECLRTLTEKLISGVLSSGLDWDLASNNAQQIALHLNDNPAQILELEALFSAMTSPQEKEVVLFVMSKLQREKLFASAQRLSHSNTPEDRIAGLSLLESSIGSNVSIAQELAQVIDVETNEKVLVRAINIIDELTADEVGIATRARLSELIESSENEDIVSAALFAKISVATDDEDIRKNISGILQPQSNTDNLKLLGLQALDKVLARQQYKPEQGDWLQDPEFRNQVANLANDVDASPTIRIEALNLLRRHFR